jgi:hypothetical protein
VRTCANETTRTIKIQCVAAGGWRLAAGGWRLAAGGWRLAAGGWRISVKNLDIHQVSAWLLGTDPGCLTGQVGATDSAVWPFPRSLTQKIHSHDILT